MSLATTLGGQAFVDGSRTRRGPHADLLPLGMESFLGHAPCANAVLLPT